MENFIAYNPVKLYFGKDVVKELGNAVLHFGKKVLLLYGHGSIKQNGVYNDILTQLDKIDAEVFEYYGIKANPVVEDADKAIQLGIDKQVDVIVAVGGGSVIDTAKFVSLSIPEQHAAWDVVTRKVDPQSNIPLIAVLTLAATGTEMNANAVLQNHKTEQKLGFSHELAYPVYSFLDPRYTFSVSKEQTANGIVDAIAHCFEAYFGYGDAPLSDRFVEVIVKEVMHNGPMVLGNPQGYEQRANLMWDATCALNGINDWGKSSGDWGVHSLGHILSLLFDTAHGATLSIAIPAWMRLQANRIPERIIKLGKQLFGVDSIEDTIREIEEFFISIERPVRLQHIGIDKNKKQEIVRVMTKNKCSGMNHILSVDDYPQIVENMLLY